MAAIRVSRAGWKLRISVLLGGKFSVGSWWQSTMSNQKMAKKRSDSVHGRRWRLRVKRCPHPTLSPLATRLFLLLSNSGTETWRMPGFFLPGTISLLHSVACVPSLLMQTQRTWKMLGSMAWMKRVGGWVGRQAALLRVEEGGQVLLLKRALGVRVPGFVRGPMVRAVRQIKT